MLYNYLSILPALSAILCLGLGLFTFSRNVKHPANIGFALGMAALIVSEIGSVVVLFSPLSQDMALNGMRIVIIGESFMPVAWLVFSLFFARASHREVIKMWSPVLALVFLSGLVFCFNIGSSGFVYLEPSEFSLPLFSLGSVGKSFYIFIILGLVLSLVQLENTFRVSVGEQRLQIKYVIFGVGGILSFIIYLASQTLLFSMLDIKMLPVRSAVILISVSIMALFIVRHKLLESDIYISRYVIFNSATILIVGFYLLTVGLVTQGIKYFNIPFNYFISTLFVFVSVLILVIFLFTPALNRKVQHFINRHFYRHKYDFRGSWMESIEAISPKTTEEEIQETLKDLIMKKIGVRHFYMWLYDPIFRGYSLAVTVKPLDCTRIEEDHSLISVIKSKMAPFMIDETTNSMNGEKSSEIDRFIEGTEAVLCAPLIAGRQIVGFILLGREITGEEYVENDFEILNALTTQAAIQIKNIRLGNDLINAKEVEAFSKMSYFITHDLKNLTNSLSLLSQNAKHNMDNPEFQRDALNTIDKTTLRMKRLIEKLSTVPRGIELKRQTVDLSVMIDHAISKVPLSKEKNIVITKDIDGFPDVFVDPESMEMVILNLLTNAYDAIQGTGSITIRVFKKMESVNVEISDTGVGMTSEFMKNSLFKPFTSTKENGFGIGLYQCKDIVEAHGGWIGVVSRPEEGTTFNVNLSAGQEDGG